MRTMSWVCVVCVLGIAATAQADVVGPGFALRTGGVAGEPMLLDSSRGYSGGFQPNTGYSANVELGLNSATGTVYALDLDGSGPEKARMDPAAEYEKGQAAVDAAMGTTRFYTTTYHFRGAVSGGSDVGGSNMSMGLSYDPYMLTNGQTGVITVANSGSTPNWQEYIAQTAAEGLGALNEGTVGSPSDTSARTTKVTMVDGMSGLPGLGHWHGLEMDRLKGQFAPVNDAATASLNDAGGLVSRYFMGTPGFGIVFIVHADATRSLEPTTTTMGDRQAYKRDRSNAQAILLTATDTGNLVASIGDTIRDMAQDPVTGDLFFVSGTSTEAYLSAVRPTIDDDSDVAPSFEVVDLDDGSAATHLVLSSLHSDLAAAGGLTFSADGLRLYLGVAANSNVTGEVRAVYALDVTPVPEPATMGLLGLGLTAIAAIRRRRGK